MPSANEATTGSRPEVALVTGASGFIGSHLVEILLREGVRVRALVQRGAPLQNLKGLDIEQVEGDLRDGASLERALAGCDTLFHLAAIFATWLPDPADMYRVNVEGTVRLLTAAKAAGVRRVIHTSSIAAVGTRPGGAPADETTQFNTWDSADDYVLSKYISEIEALRFNALGLPVVVVNPVFPFGSNDIAPTPTGLIIQRYVEGKNPFYFKGGFCVANVRDIAMGHWLAALRGRANERYILGGYNVSHREFAFAACRAAGVPLPRWEMPTGPLSAAGKVAEWFADHVTHKAPMLADRSLRYLTEHTLYFNIAKATAELGYRPGPLEDAIAEAVAWFKTGRERRLSGS